MRTGMIVLAGGIGRRIGRPVPKQFLLLGGKPLLIHVLEKARAIPEIERALARKKPVEWISFSRVGRGMPAQSWARR